MSEHVGMYRDAYGNIKRNVCAQCKHFYTRIDKGAGDTSGLDEYDLHISPDGTRNADEIRLCYEIHWCNAASPVCDGDFEPLDDVEITGEITATFSNPALFDEIMGMSDEEASDLADELLESCESGDFSGAGEKFEDFNAKYPGVRKMIGEFTRPQKEIQYVYIGLLQNTDEGLVEVPANVNGAATNYQRVEMGPVDWDYFFQDAKGTRGHEDFHPNTATNAVGVVFPVEKLWGLVEYFGVYSSLVGGKPIMASKFGYVDNLPAGDCASIVAGGLEIPLKYLMKGGE